MLFNATIAHAGTSTSPSFSDSVIENLVNHFRYKEASARILQRLEKPEHRNPDQQLYFYNRLSLVNLRMRNIDSALAMARISLVLVNKSKDSALIAEAWRVNSYAFNNAGKLDSALFYTQKMLGYAERHQEERMMRNALVSISTIMSQNKRFHEALEYYRKARYLTTKLKDTSNYPTCLYNLGLTHLNLNSTDSCLFYMNKALEAPGIQNQPDVQIYIYGTMADCYLVMKNEKQRKKYLILANGVAEKLGNKQFLSMGYSNLTQGALSEGNYREALIYGTKTLALLKSQPYPVLKMKIDSMMWLVHNGLGQYQQALSYMVAYTKEKDLLVGEHQKDKLNQLTLNLAVKEKDLMIANQQIELTDKKRKIEVLTLLVAFIILLATGQFIYVIRTRAFRRELFRKEKELDQFQLDVRNWMEWKKRRDESDAEQKPLTGEISVADRADTGVIQVALFNELRDIFDKQKLYLDPEINLNMVIRLLGTNKKYLYQAISENTDANFRNFVNRYRIDEAKMMMETKVAANEEINLSEISYAVGFNSHVSFYRAFKTATGLIPSDYLKEIKAQMKR